MILRISKPELIRLQKKHKTDEAIGKKFGVTRQRIYQIRRDYGILPIREKNKERNSRIIALRGKGISARTIAEKMGISESWVSEIIRSSKMTSKKKKK
jgi:transcriptional regulator with XRE-family HTH domain